SLPGLRVGFAAGDRRFLAPYLELRNIAAPQVPTPAQYVAIAAYGDETHVQENRELYSAKFDLADQIIGGRYGYVVPAGGFFLWLEVSKHGGSEMVTKNLWSQAGVRVVPGRYLAREQNDGSNPGEGYIRVAMVQDKAATAEALHRLVAVLGEGCNRMRAADRSLDIITFVSEHFRDIIRRRLSELAGLALISLAILGAIALATWSIQDPSLSHATQKPIHNLLGFSGAIFADLAMQLLGLASILLLLPELLLGWRLLSHRPVGEKWRSLLWIVATFLAAAFASTLPHAGSWPLPTGLGGVAGDAMLRAPAWIFGSPLGGFTRFILCVVFGLATAVTLLLATRAPDYDEKPAAREVDDEEDNERDDADGDHASAWLGMIVHALLSWKARIGRMIRGDAHARAPMPVVQG